MTEGTVEMVIYLHEISHLRWAQTWQTLCLQKKYDVSCKPRIVLLSTILGLQLKLLKESEPVIYKEVLVSVLIVLPAVICCQLFVSITVCSQCFST